MAFVVAPLKLRQKPCHRRRAVLCTSAEGSSDDERKVHVFETLRHDLPRQYDAVRSLDLSIFSNDVTFDDPVTKLRGKLLYKGMLYTIAAIRTIAFSSAEFLLDEIDFVEDRRKIRTRWKTIGTARWGQSYHTSGTDYFHLSADNECLITRHESIWDNNN